LSGLHTLLQKRINVGIFCCKQLQRWNGFKEMSGKWLKIAVSHVPFSDFAPAFFILLRLAINALRLRVFYNFKYLKIGCKGKLYNTKLWVFVNCVSHRKLMYLTTRNEFRPVWQIEQYKCHFANKIVSF
jgi:hypothetical protein